MGEEDIHCSLPSAINTFVGSPDVRGTLDIAFPCVAVLLLCTWSSVHLNVPIQTLPRTSREAAWRSAYLFWRKLLAVLFGICLPEYALAKAWAEANVAASLAGQFTYHALRHNVTWTFRHIHLVNAGGSPVEFDPYSRESPVNHPTARHSSLPRNVTDNLTPPDYGRHRPARASRPGSQLFPASVFDRLKELDRTHATRDDPQPRMGKPKWRRDAHNAASVREVTQHLDRFQFSDMREVDDISNDTLGFWSHMQSFRNNIFTLNGKQTLLALDMGILDKLPNISEDDISDRDKSSTVIKLLALWQLIWFIAQLALRFKERLATTLLEITTLGIALCATCTYLLLLKTPQEILTPFTVIAARYPSPGELITLAAARSRLSYRDRWASPTIHGLGFSPRGIGYDGIGIKYVLPALLFGSTIFGAAHCIAWNFAFPSDTERLLWRVSALITIGTVPLMVVGVLITGILVSTGLGPDLRHSRLAMLCRELSSVAFVAMVALYIAARVFVIWEACRSLAFLTPQAFRSSSLISWPHFH